MTLRSMTAFARVDGSHGPTRWHWEIRSVNGRGFDVRHRLPGGFEALEPRLREVLSRSVTRGSLNATLVVERDAPAVDIRLNEQALAQVVHAAERISALLKAPPPSAEALLGIRGVLEIVEGDIGAGDDEALRSAVLASFEGAVDRLVAGRAAEGERLAATIAHQLDEIERLVAEAAKAPARSPAAIAQRLKENLQRVIDNAAGFDPDRLHQEAVLLATRADIEEELQRLGAHVAAARGYLKAKEPVGRKFDFLSQEFNREANTLCSKSNDVELTRVGLALKTVIDQMREQVQNIE